MTEPSAALFSEVCPHLDPCGMTTEELRATINYAFKEAIEAAILEEREACAKITDDEADWCSGENDQGYVNGDAEDMLRWLSEAIRKRGQS